jgi:hypothetical protein
MAIQFASCRKRERMKVELTDEGTGQLASMIHAADPRASVQFVKGFHDIEQNAWRWTMGRFSVTLRPPKDAATKGATLQLRLSVPDAILERLKSVTLTAAVNGRALDPETYSKAGEYVYTRDVPAAALAGDGVAVDFALDKFLPPGQVDQRELGVVVSSVGFEPK